MNTGNQSSLNRRESLAAMSAMASAALLVGGSQDVAAAAVEPTIKKFGDVVGIFAKPLQFLSFPDLASQLEKWQVAGIEATIRKGGQVEPEKIETELPRLVEALEAKGQSILIATTDVATVDQPLTERTLKALAKHGVKRYRMAHRHYDLSRSIKQQLEVFAKEARELANLNASLGITGLYQNHAGSDYLGAPLWDIAAMLDGINPQHLGTAFDIRHTSIEAGQSWEIDYRVVKPHIGAVFAKDGRWQDNKLQEVPLGQGPIASKIFEQVEKDQLQVPISLHMEYYDHTDPKMLQPSIEAITRDLATLRGWLNT